MTRYRPHGQPAARDPSRPRKGRGKRRTVFLGWFVWVEAIARWALRSRRRFAALVAAAGAFVIALSQFTSATEQIIDAGSNVWRRLGPDMPPTPTVASAEVAVLSEVRLGEPNITLATVLRDEGRSTDGWSQTDLDWPGQLITFRVELEGFPGQRLTVRWTLYDDDTDRRVPAVGRRSTSLDFPTGNSSGKPSGRARSASCGSRIRPRAGSTSSSCCATTKGPSSPGNAPRHSRFPCAPPRRLSVAAIPHGGSEPGHGRHECPGPPRARKEAPWASGSRSPLCCWRQPLLGPPTACRRTARPARSG